MNQNKKFFNYQSFIGIFMIAVVIIVSEYRILHGEELKVGNLFFVLLSAIFLIIVGY